jgi:hypothetical protein
MSVIPDEGILNKLVGGTVVGVDRGFLIIRKGDKDYYLFGHDGGQIAELDFYDHNPFPK